MNLAVETSSFVALKARLSRVADLIEAHFSSVSGENHPYATQRFLNVATHFFDALAKPGAKDNIPPEHAKLFNRFTASFITSAEILGKHLARVDSRPSLDVLHHLLNELVQDLAKLPPIDLSPRKLILPSAVNLPKKKGVIVSLNLSSEKSLALDLVTAGRIGIPIGKDNDRHIAAHLDATVHCSQAPPLLVTDFEIPCSSDGFTVSLTKYASEQYGDQLLKQIHLPHKSKADYTFLYHFVPQGTDHQPLPIPPGHIIVSCEPIVKTDSAVDATQLFISALELYSIVPDPRVTFYKIETAERPYLLNDAAVDLINSL